MTIGLIDLDYNGSFPNIPLMKISAWHKAQGDEVEWYDFTAEQYDIGMSPRCSVGRRTTSTLSMQSE